MTAMICQNLRLKIISEHVVPAAFIGLLSFVLTGCERLPSTTYVKNSDNFPADTVDPTWVEKTSWRAQNGGFAIKQPPLFGFLSQQPRLQRLTVGEHNAANGISDYEKPSWMDDDVYLAFRNYVEPPSPFVRTLQRGIDGKAVKACALSRDGSRMILIQDSITVLDLEKANDEKSISNPLIDCIDAAIDRHAKHAILYGDSRLVKISLDDGNVVQQTGFPSNEGRLVCFAANSDLIGVATEHGELMVLDEQWKSGPTLAFDAKAFRTTANRKSLAMDANGDSIAVATSQGISAWRLNGKASISPLRQNTRTTQFTSQEEAAKVLDVVFCGDTKFYSLTGAVVSTGTIERKASSGAAALAFATAQGLSQSSRIVPELVEVCHCQSERNSWLVFFRRLSGENTNRLIVHDVFDCEANAEHTTAYLDVIDPLMISMSGDGTKIAIVSKDKLEIWSRRVTDSTGFFLARKLGELFEKGRFEQLDKCFIELQRLNVFRGIKSRDEFNQMIVAELARRYPAVMAGKANTALQDFITGESDLSIDLHRQIFTQAGFSSATLIGSSPGNFGLGGQPRIIQHVTEESLSRSLDEGDLSLARFRKFLQDGPCELGNLPSVINLLKRYVERFPEHDEYHVEVILWLEKIGKATVERYLEDVCAMAPEGQAGKRLLRIMGKLSSRIKSNSLLLADFDSIPIDLSSVEGPIEQSALQVAIRHANAKQDGGLLAFLMQRYANEHPLVPTDLNWQVLKVQMPVANFEQ